MDARLVWETWRRILTSDQLVEGVLHPNGAAAAPGLTSGEIAVLAAYSATPLATGTNIGMYRRGLVRNALAALSLVPLSRRLLYASDRDVEAVAADFAKSTGYVDDGPYFWLIAGGFVAYLARLPEFAAGAKQDALALDAAAVALARRLGDSPVDMWPESAGADHCETRLRNDGESAHFIASRAAVVASSSHDLTAWLENPEDFDADEDLPSSKRHWLIYFAAADAAPAYAELSERTARVFNLLSAPKTVAEASLALHGLSAAEVLEVINSLAELGVVVREEDCLAPRANAALSNQGIREGQSYAPRGDPRAFAARS